MGLKKEYIEFIMKQVEPIRGKTMLELGNQIVRSDVSRQYKTGKEYWASLGVVHVSIDINGKDGAIAIDLEKPVERWPVLFDVVTDIGTSCYMDNYQQCHDNMVMLCKSGGTIIHILPFVGSNWTAKWYCSDATIAAIAKKHRLCIQDVQMIDGEYGQLIAVAIRKVNNE